MTDTAAPDPAAPDTATAAAAPDTAPDAAAPDTARPTRVAIRTCPLCEATCGLELTLQGDKVMRIRGDRQDVFSHGYLCPKGSTLKQLHEDPDRLRQPLVKRNGRHVEVSWAEAFAEVDRLLVPIVEQHGRDAVAVYLGNPTAHHLSPQIFNRVLLQALGTRNRFSASTADQMPKQVAAGYMFGTALSVPVPDLDRTDYLLMLGANPYASNGSLCTAPDFPGRLEAMRARGGKLVVVDPRRSRTAEEADEWLAVRPGGDALLLMGMVHALFEAGLADPGPHVAPHVAGLDDVRALAEPFSPEAVAPGCGIDAVVIRRIASELAAAPAAAVYGRIGTCTQAFGTLASWLVDVLNVLTGNLDRPGGAMFTLPATGGPTTRGRPGVGKGIRIGRGRTRVRGLPEVLGEYPVVTLAEEMEGDDEGRVRALVTVAGNPVLSTPNANRLDAALANLDAMVAIDIYLNETTRHADVILPPPSVLQRPHYDISLLQLAVRNVANYSPAVLPLEPGQPDEWEIMAKVALIALGQGPDADPSALDDQLIAGMVEHAVADPRSPVNGREPEELLKALGVGGRRGPERVLDFMLRTGPYGDAFAADGDGDGGGDGDGDGDGDSHGLSHGLSLTVLEANPHGIDFGPLEPRLPDVLRTPSGKVELAPPELAADCRRLAGALQPAPSGELLLVGRRNLRSNNSWMHNINVLVKGRAQCTLQVHPDDADRLGLVDGEAAIVASRVGRVRAPVELTDGIRPGVVSLPHGWGHDLDGMALAVAAAHAGANSNVLADHEAFDPLSGNAVFNGIPVTVAPG
jgi:anaerobic selenocysteine-containing dehydrogenase